jgi:hypothetical protein
VEPFDSGNAVTEFHSADKCPVLAVGTVDDKVAPTPAPAACTDAVVATYKNVYNKDCLDKFTVMSGTTTTAPSFELICKSPCIGLLLTGFSNVKAACPAATATTTSGPGTDDAFKLFCKKNESGAYCGDALYAFSTSTAAKRYGLSASSSKAEITAALRTDIESSMSAYRFASRQATATTTVAPSTTTPTGTATGTSTTSTATPAPVDICASFKPFLDLQAKVGCCIGEIIKMVFSTAGATQDTAAILTALTSCGIKTSLCVADKAIYGSIFVNLALKVSGTLDTAAREKLKTGLANDLATFWGIDASRITVTLTTAARLHALEQTVKATAEVAGTPAGATELAALKTTLDTKGAAAVPTTQTNAALAGSTAGTTTVSSATATQLSPGATPPPATAGASALALPALALLIASIAALL